MTVERDAAWARLHDPVTDAVALAEIAGAYPEFADAVARHPNAYPELIAWARTLEASEQSHVPQPEPVDHSPEARSAAARRPVPRWALIGGIAAAAVLVLGGAGWAAAALLPSLWGGGQSSAAADGSGTADSIPTPTRTLAGDPVYIGDELEWFLPTEAQRATLSPGGSQTETDANYYTDGESAGAEADTPACLRWILTDERSIVGVRRATWQPNGAPARAFWSAFEFPTDELAEAYYRSFADTLAGCGRFQMLTDKKPYRTITLELAAGATDSTSFVVRETDDDGKTTRALAREGNVVVLVSVPDSSAANDANAYAAVLGDLTARARVRLTDEIGYR